MILRDPGAAFLDRDGTVNAPAEPGGYIERPSEVRLLDGAAAAVRRLNDAGVRVVVITNQRGVALGQMTDADVGRVHEQLTKLIAEATGGRIDGYFYCPHEIGTCSCRKPEVGLFLQAKERWPEIDFAASAMVGDSAADVAAGHALGMRSIRLGQDVTDLAAAVNVLLDGGALLASR